MTNGWIIGILLGLLLPLPEDICGAWRWWRRQSEELPAPPPLTRQDGAIFDHRAAQAIDEGPSYFSSRSTTIIRGITTSLPRTVSTDLSRWSEHLPEREENSLAPAPASRVNHNRNYSVYTSCICLFFRTDYLSRRSDQ